LEKLSSWVGIENFQNFHSCCLDQVLGVQTPEACWDSP
jgi:hypothetical protein